MCFWLTGAALLYFISVRCAADPALAACRDIRERDLVRRDGLFVAEGKVVLSALLRLICFRPIRCWLRKTVYPALELLLRRHQPDCPVYIAPQPVMDGIAGFHVHRGVPGGLAGG